MNLELQQRAVEYNLVIKKYDNLREGLFEQMPPLEMRANINLPNGVNDEAENNEEAAGAGNEASLMGDDSQQQKKQKEDATKTLLDLFDDDISSTPVQTPTTNITTSHKANNDLFRAKSWGNILIAFE